MLSGMYRSAPATELSDSCRIRSGIWSQVFIACSSGILWGGGGGQLGSSVDLSQAGLQVELGSFAKVSRAV